MARLPEWQLAAPLNLDLYADEHIAIVGPNGSGKTKLAEILIGKHPLFGDYPKYDFSPSERTLVSENIKYITFKDCYGADNDRTYYLQQRWNQQEIAEDTPTVRDKLEEALLGSDYDEEQQRDEIRRIVGLFQLEKLMDKYIILLSSGELRKLKLACSLVGRPRVLMIDNPFVGLDAETRAGLSALLEDIISQQSLQLILILSRAQDIPSVITHVIEMDHGRAGVKMSVGDYMAKTGHERLSEEVVTGSAEHLAQSCLCRQPTVLCLRHITLRASSRFRREYLGHQEAYRICLSRDAQGLQEKSAYHTSGGQRIERLYRALRQAHRTRVFYLRMVVIALWIGRDGRAWFSHSFRRRATHGVVGTGVRQGSAFAYSR